MSFYLFINTFFEKNKYPANVCAILLSSDW